MTLDRQNTAYKFMLDDMDTEWIVTNCGEPYININSLQSVLLCLTPEQTEVFHQDFQAYLGTSVMLVEQTEPTQFERIFDHIIAPLKEYLLYSL